MRRKEVSGGDEELVGAGGPENGDNLDDGGEGLYTLLSSQSHYCPSVLTRTKVLPRSPCRVGVPVPIPVPVPVPIYHSPVMAAGFLQSRTM